MRGKESLVKIIFIENCHFVLRALETTHNLAPWLKLLESSLSWKDCLTSYCYSSPHRSSTLPVTRATLSYWGCRMDFYSLGISFWHWWYVLSNNGIARKRSWFYLPPSFLSAHFISTVNISRLNCLLARISSRRIRLNIVLALAFQRKCCNWYLFAL